MNKLIKENMKKLGLILLLLAFIFPCLAKDKIKSKKGVEKTTAFIIAQRNLKPFGLAHCISKFHRGDTIPKDIELAKSSYFEGANISNEAFHEIRDYVEKTIPKNMLYTPLDMEPMYFLSCVQMYDSLEYHNFVNKLIKKYL